MSGGSLDYISYRVEEHIGCFDDDRLDNLLKDMAKLLHDREWYLSSDTCEGSWNLAKKEFEEKWLSYDDTQRYCRDCKHFEKSDLKYAESNYGRCEFERFCMTHEYESVCEKFERMEGVEGAEE